MDYALVVLALVGFWYIVGRSKLSQPFRRALFDTHFRPFRWLVELVECPACLCGQVGLWTALAAPEKVGAFYGWTAHPALLVVFSTCVFTGVGLVFGVWSQVIQFHSHSEAE